MEQENELMTTTQIQIQTGISQRTLNKWIECGYIAPKGVNDKGRTLIKLSDVIKYNTSHPVKNRDCVWDEISAQEDEDFRLIKGYDDRYAASKNQIVNFTNGRSLEISHPRKDGYVVVYLQKNGKSIPVYAHTLTADLFCENKRKVLFPRVKWETHHIDVGFNHRKDMHPDKLLPVTEAEHKELHRLWNNGREKEYMQMVKRIKRINNEEWFKIPHPDYSSDKKIIYYMFVTKKGYLAYKKGKAIPIDTIRCESAEATEVTN